MTKSLVAAATPVVDIANAPSSNYYVYFLISENAIAPFNQRDRYILHPLTNKMQLINHRTN
ncbi:hypothetical protein [Nostoc sp.]|uniref:hypothetical protein n=1 Tax=Nostoc sp. TaxID=1180 RepID=UPI0035933BD7